MILILIIEDYILKRKKKKVSNHSVNEFKLLTISLELFSVVLVSTVTSKICINCKFLKVYYYFNFITLCHSIMKNNLNSCLLISSVEVERKSMFFISLVNLLLSLLFQTVEKRLLTIFLCTRCKCWHKSYLKIEISTLGF